jgi:hypothetical protein
MLGQASAEDEKESVRLAGVVPTHDQVTTAGS